MRDSPFSRDSNFAGHAVLFSLVVAAGLAVALIQGLCLADERLPAEARPANRRSTEPQSANLAKQIPVYTYRVINVYPHSTDAFTEGLVLDGDYLLESTGNYGSSTLRRVKISTGEVVKSRRLETKYFGEGATVFGDRIIQLTWKTHVGFVYDRRTFKLLRTFSYPTEGWGITRYGTRLIMSDGTSILRFLDPHTFRETGRIQVRDDVGPVNGLNELEYVRGEIFANVWPTDRIARISPESGRVSGWIELGGLLSFSDLAKPVDVLNGIAYDSKQGRLFVTGKFWPKLFEIEVVPRNHRSE